jgi:glutamate synthase (NADPH/NADH) large chain
MTGQVGRLDASRAVRAWKQRGIDLSRVLHEVDAPDATARRHSTVQNHGLAKAFDHKLIAAAKATLGEAMRGTGPVEIALPIRNGNRATGTMLSGEVARRFGHAGLPAGAIRVKLTGTAGQSFGAFLARGVSLELTGEANDYVGKGLSGGRIIVRQPPQATREAAVNIIVGNTVLYGAIAGEAHFEGVAGERFAVRNSGAVSVVEGLGDHGCEYMTGGVVVVLGATGRNFAAGMSGGIAYVWDPEGRFSALCNTASVELSPLGSERGAVEYEMGSREHFHPSLEAPSVEDAGMGDPLRFDAERLRILIERHHRLTGSARAGALLEDWATTLAAFVKVTPLEYRRALGDLARERALAAVAAE